MMKNKDVQEQNYMEFPMIACLLAMASGLIDGYTYSTTKVFATFQTGNIFLPTWHLSTISFHDFVPGIVSLLSFGSGVMALAFIRDICLKYHKVWTVKILSLEIFLILLLASNGIHHILTPLHLAWLLAFVIGIQGNAFRQVDNMLYSNITSTLNVLFTFSFLAEALQKRDKRKIYLKKSFDYFVVFICFFIGVFISTILYRYYHILSFTTAVIPLLVIIILGKLSIVSSSRFVK